MDASTSTLAPPSYPAPPCYTLDARADERVLSRTTRRPRARADRPRVNHNTKSAFCSVALHGARDGADLPTYCRGDVLDGTVTLTSTKRVTSVSVALEGKMKCTFGEGLADSFTFLSNPYTLWDTQSLSPSSVLLHEPHSFSIPLPSTFDDNGTTRPLPASFAFSQGDFSASIEYRLVVRVAARRPYVGVTNTRRLIVPVAYRPRLRPPRAPLSHSTTLLETLKVAPDEWASVSLGVFPSKTKCQLWEPLQCEVAFPSSRVFSAGQAIPIHLQVSGDTRALGALSVSFPATASTSPVSSHSSDFDLPSYDSIFEHNSPSRPGSSCSSHSHLTSSSSATLVSHPDLETAKPGAPALFSVSVLLERRIALLGPLGPTWRTHVLAAASLHVAQHREGWLALDGALPVPVDAALGPSIRIGALGVVDYLVVAVTGDGPYTSAERRVPVVVVSDGFFGDGEDEAMEL